MGSFNVKMHQNRFLPGLRPGPRWGSLRRSPRPLVGWGGGHLLPIPPLDAFGVSISCPGQADPTVGNPKQGIVAAVSAAPRLPTLPPCR